MSDVCSRRRAATKYGAKGRTAPALHCEPRRTLAHGGELSRQRHLAQADGFGCGRPIRISGGGAKGRVRRVVKGEGLSGNARKGPAGDGAGLRGEAPRGEQKGATKRAQLRRSG